MYKGLYLVKLKTNSIQQFDVYAHPPPRIIKFDHIRQLWSQSLHRIEKKYSCVETQVTFYVNIIYFAIFVTCKKIRKLKL